MRAKIVVLNQELEFLDAATAELTGAGHDVTAFSDPMIFLEVIEVRVGVDLLITAGAFGGKKPHGISVALMAKQRFNAIKVLFTVGPDLAALASEIGWLVPATVGPRELLTAVQHILTLGAQLAGSDRDRGAATA
jgi:hypothetical protein